MFNFKKKENTEITVLKKPSLFYTEFQIYFFSLDVSDIKICVAFVFFLFFTNISENSKKFRGLDKRSFALICVQRTQSFTDIKLFVLSDEGLL